MQPEIQILRGDAIASRNKADAWIKFFESKAFDLLEKGGFTSHQDHWYQDFNELHFFHEGTEDDALKAINGALLNGAACEFVRRDIFDKRAECRLLLSDFISGTQEDVEAVFCVPKPMTISRSHFKLRHRVKWMDRIAVLEFVHPNLESQFNGSRHALEGKFPKETSRQVMFDALIEKLKSELNRNLTYFSDEPLEIEAHKIQVKLTLQDLKLRGAAYQTSLAENAP